MNIPLKKLKSILKYFYTHTDKRLLGKTKLMKLFYFVDFGHVKKYGTPITYDTYINLEHGPIPSTILNMVNSVVDDPEGATLADTILIKQDSVSGLHRVECLTEFSDKDKKLFSNSELNILEEICKKFGDKTGKYTENISHSEFPWSSTQELDKIPYSLACGDVDCDLEDDEIKILEQVLKRNS